jgi:hypothetical protein
MKPGVAVGVGGRRERFATAALRDRGTLGAVPHEGLEGAVGDAGLR